MFDLVKSLLVKEQVDDNGKVEAYVQEDREHRLQTAVEFLKLAAPLAETELLRQYHEMLADKQIELATIKAAGGGSVSEGEVTH